MSPILLIPLLFKDKPFKREARYIRRFQDRDHLFEFSGQYSIIMNIRHDKWLSNLGEIPKKLSSEWELKSSLEKESRHTMPAGNSGYIVPVDWALLYKVNNARICRIGPAKLYDQPIFDFRAG